MAGKISKRAQRELEKVRQRAIDDAARPVPLDPEEEANADAHYPCPVDGKTLYGWTASKKWDGGESLLLDHCEECGLVVTRAKRPPDVGLEVERLERDGDELVIPNRASFAAWLGAAGWADLDAEKYRLHMTEQAARALLPQQGIEVLEVKARFSWRSYRAMLQTMINAFTLNNNFGRRWRAGTLRVRSTSDRLAIALDTVVTVLTAIPLSVVALLVEGIAGLSNRGGLLRVRTAALSDSSGDPR